MPCLQYLLFISMAILITSIGLILAQNIVLNEQIQSINANSQKLQHVLNNYTDTFGDVSFDQNDVSTSNWKLEAKAFIATSLDELTPITDVKINERYSVTGIAARPSGISDYPPLLGYVMYVQVLNSNDEKIAGSWYQGEIRVNQEIAAGTYWVPTDVGTYTIEVFVWQSFTGTPHAEPARININVTD